ncbi:hypothetical protein PIROE2DRAFT_2649 [Piromyces sp. E2]|nr:hypothetical protein PIROE2DRAFT_2649 [Piromyces sp. E2]|eukprot:OUM69356.1 hypothetical protein PIROE2DRAFT_2649 [Piromyces sp. E2]
MIKLCDDVIKLIDNVGKEFIYAYDDLIKREKELLKIGTCYLNTKTTDQLIEYSLEMKEIGYDIFKDQEIKNSTYLNPKYDRAELLYELYDYETRYQSTKINLINCYLEIYENATNEEDILRLAQIITNLINIKPIVHYNDKYFSHSYLCEINSLENHLRLVKNILIYTLERTKSFYSYVSLNVVNNDDNGSNNNNKKIFNGMPRFNNLKNKYYPINMHFPEVSLNISDIYPNLGEISNLMYIQDDLNKEFIDYYKYIFQNKTPDPIYKEDKNNKTGKYYMESKYKDFNEEDYESSMNVLFLNSEFNYRGKDILLNYLKMISSRNKLLYSYIETVSVVDENYENFNMFNIDTDNSKNDNNHNKMNNKNENKINNISHNNFDNNVNNDNNKNNDNDNESNKIEIEKNELSSKTFFKNDIAHEIEEFRNLIEDTDFFTVPHQDFKPLLYNEIIDEEEEFELPSYNNIIKYIDENELIKMLQALKLQQLEQINYNSFINLHKYCMFEIYPILINEYIKHPPQDEVSLNKKNGSPQKSNDMNKQKRNINYNIKYSNLVFTNSTEKMVLKLIIKKEWNKINKKIIHLLSSFEGDIQDRALYKLSIERKEKVL